MFEKIEKNMLTTEELAAYLGLRPQSIYKMRMLGRGPDFTKIGRLVKYPRQAVLEWLERNTRHTTATAE